MSRVVICGGHVVDPANGIDETRDVYIADGRIVAVGAAPGGFEADQVIDAQHLVVCPGLVDLRARPREPGQEYKGTIASECAAAVAGGVTTLCCPPDTDPVNDTPAVTDLILHRANEAGTARIVTLGALTLGLRGTQLAEMSALQRAGCVGVSNAQHAVADSQVLRRAFEYAASLGLRVFIHAEDDSLAKGCVNESAVSARLGLTGVPEIAETVAVGRDLLLIQHTGVSAHFCGLSTARAVQMIARAQYDGLPVTADVAVHHLHLTEMDVTDFNTQCHVRPPLRTTRDRDALRSSVQRGTLGAVCSDHQPHDPDAKEVPFAESEPGVSGIETLLPLLLRVQTELRMTLGDVLARVTSGPAQILGIEAGTLGVGRPADVCVFDPNETWLVRPEQLRSRGRNTPFGGWEMRGRVKWTLAGGKVVYGRQ
jgi:dihydroorotase